MSTEITVVNDIVEINVTEEVIVIEAPSGAYPLPTGVYSVYGRTGNVIAQDGDYSLTQLGDVTIVSPSTGQVLRYNGTTWVNSTETYVGTVTSVDMSVPTGLTISGNPITTAGTLAVGLQSGYSIPTTAKQTTWDTAYNDSIVSAAVTGVQTKTLTLNQQDGGTVTASWTDYDTAPVTSVFGRTGAITAQSGDYNSLQVTENTNLYFTDQRARYAISGDATSGVVYSNTTGIIALDDIPNTSLLNPSLTVNGKTVALGASTTLTTTDIGEGTNLYFTTGRAQAAITGTSPISVTSGVVSISQSGPTSNGYLSSTDFNTFNAKQSALTLGNLTSSDITVTGGTGAVVGSGSTLTLATVNSNVGAFGSSTSVPTITVNAKGLVTAASQTAIPTASSTTTGLLTSANWTTFNNKQNALSGTGFVKSTAGVISYDTNTYLTTISGIAAGGELSGTYANPSLVNSAVIGKVLTGLNITGGAISATDSILTAFGKVQNQINGLIGGSIYQGTWNASTNTPTLTSSVGTKGYYYIVSVAGTTNLNGITDWQLGDWAIYDGTAWQKVDNTDAVVSVNGFTGAVSLTTSNISEGSNLYYTDTRARASVSAGTGISYSSSTGVITNTAPDRTVALTGAGTTSISGTYPNFTITSNDQYVGTVTSVGITESAAALTITGSPITTSGNINIAFAGASTDYVAGDGSLVPFPSVVTQAENLVTQVYNNSGATITKGTVVYINGGQGNLPTIAKALATSDSTSAQTYGIVRTDITNMNNGYVTVIGNLDNIDTQAYAAGTQLYLSGTTAGAWTDVKPSAPIHLVYVGIVVRSHPTQGVVEVRIQNGYELDELHNVSAQSPNSGDILQYVSSTSLWTSVAGTTSNITEGSRLYYTDARARAAVSLTTTGNNGASTYNSTTGVLNVPTYTLAGLGGINLTSLSATSPLLYNNTTGVFSIQQASGSQAGYLSAADWTTFNSKQGALTFSSPLVNTAGTITINQATTSTNGYLSSTDWNTFNNKQSAITLTTTGTSGAATFSAGTLNIPQYQAALTNPVTGTGTSGYHAKFTGTSTLGNGIIYDDGTNIGIGTTTPSYKLDVRGIYDASGIISIRSTDTAAINIGGVLGFGGFHNGSSNQSQWAWIKGAKENSNGNDNASYLSFATMVSGGSPIEKMRISSTGNVGIGTSSPDRLLQISKTTGQAVFSIIGATNDSTDIFFGDTDNNAEAVIRFINGTNSLNFLNGGSTRMTILTGGNVGIGTNTPGSTLQVVGGDIWLGSYHATNKLALGADTNHFVRYSSAIDGAEISGYQGVLFSTLGGTEKMRLSSAGDLYIGGTTSLSSGGLLVGNNSSTRPIVIIGANGVDGAYTTGIAFYPWNTSEQNLIQTTVSGSASASGFRFMVSNGYGTTGVTESFRINRTSCTVIGSLSKGSGSFKIDHPIETMKDTHHLVHSFVESPQANNIYRGKVQLVNGKAEVNLDAVSTMTDGTFVLLNREIHTYTSNETDWDAVRGKVESNILTIECQNNQSNAMVSWLVIGERQDKHMMDTEWTDDNGKVIVEPLKVSAL